MEQATLRPVPLRPPGPVDPAEAAEHVARSLPELDEVAARALGLIEIAGRTRQEAGDEIGLSWDVLAEALYRARKELRRSIFPLSASGWCERAERLLSDRLDGVLTPPGPARLDVHLRNCDRCLEHERRLSHARERMVREFIEAHPHADPVTTGRAPVAGLRVVEIVAIEQTPEPAGPTRVVPGFGGPRLQPVADAADLAEPSFAGPGGQAEYAPIEPRSAESGPPAEEAADEDPPIEEIVAPAEPGDATPSEHDAEEADPLVEPGEEAAEIDIEPDPSSSVSSDVAPEAVAPAPAIAAAEPPAATPEPAIVARAVGIDPGQMVWNGLTWLSVGLTTFALVITLLAATGVVERIF